MVEATAYIWPGLASREVRLSTSTGASAELTARYVGLPGMSEGKSPRAALIAACTSRVAPTTLREKSKLRRTSVEPLVLTEVISVTPAMRPRARSSGVATAETMVAGLAPGNAAETLIVGTSTSGSDAIGKSRHARAPAITSPMHSSEVATGRSMNRREMFMPGDAAARVQTQGRSPAW